MLCKASQSKFSLTEQDTMEVLGHRDCLLTDKPLYYDYEMYMAKATSLHNSI